MSFNDSDLLYFRGKGGTVKTKIYDPASYRAVLREFLASHRVECPCRIGVETEFFIVQKSTMQSLSYFDPHGARDILQRLMPNGWALIDSIEEGPIALEKNGSTITVEPGGQLELSLRPFCGIHEMAREHTLRMKDIQQALAEDVGLVGLGYHYRSHAEDMTFLPKARYQIMHEHYGRAGRAMMKGTCSTQVSIDYKDIDDFNKKLRVGNYLCGAWGRLFESAPYMDGVEQEGIRRAIWQGIDTVSSHDVVDFESYVDYLLDSKPLALMSEGVLVPTGNQTLRACLETYPMSHEEVLYTLSTVFPDIRFKGYLEIRVADAVPQAYFLAIPTIICSLLYHEHLLEKYDKKRRNHESLTKDFLWEMIEDAKSLSTTFVPILAPLEEALRHSGSIRSQVLSQGQDLLFWSYDAPTEKEAWGAQQWAKELIYQYQQSNQKEERKRVYQMVQRSSATFHGEIVPYLHLPVIYGAAEMMDFEWAIARMHTIAEKTMALYRKHAEVRAFFNFDQRLERLILQDSNPVWSVPMGRFDLFYYGDGQFTFCELNADGSSAMNEAAELVRVMDQSALVQSVNAEMGDILQSFELFDSWVDTVGELYDAAGGCTECPTVAIVDLFESEPEEEMKRFQRRFRHAGYDCHIVDARDIVTENGWMTAPSIGNIDIVYRRLVTCDMMVHWASVQGFIDGINKKTLVLGGVNTQIIHTKKFFAALHEPFIRKYFCGCDIEFIDAHIPYTRIVTAEVTRMDDIIHHPEKYILKPSDWYASQGVVAGLECSDDEWQKQLAYVIDKDYIIQTYADIAPMLNIDPTTGDVETYTSITGCFTYGRKFSGLYVRAGKGAIISGIHNGRTVAPYYIN